MGEEKAELNESKLINQSGYSPVKQTDDTTTEKQMNGTVNGDAINNKKLTGLKVVIPNGKAGK